MPELPNSKRVLRRDIADHRKECPCNASVPRKTVMYMLRNIDKVKSNKKLINFRPFSWALEDIRCRAKCELVEYQAIKITCTSVCASLLPGENNAGTVVNELLNQLEDVHHHVYYNECSESV
jgi:hypothetical protein